MTCGIYKIENKQNGKIYVGSSKRIENRWTQHIGQLRLGLHKNLKLQRAWDKYGESEFIFSIIVEVEEAQLFEVEQEFIDLYEAWSTGYNGSKTARPFEKNNKLGAKKKLKRPLDKEAIAFKGYEGQKQKLKAVPDWQERLRNFVDGLIEESGSVNQTDSDSLGSDG